MDTVPNILTVDCEEWFVAEVLASRFDREKWDDLPPTVVRNSHRLLELFYRQKVKATWFVLGWVAERHSDLLREIMNEGHEVACHSYFHRRVDQMTKEEFLQDTQRSIEAIANATGIAPIGYRAPSWSINSSVPWALEVLAELGFKYDSSIFPIKHDIYGMPKGPRQTFKVELSDGKTLWEIPASTYRLFGRNIPIAGGGYLRHAPYWYTRQIVRHLNAKEVPAVVYIHPWELDPDLPRVSGLTAIQRYRTYGSTSLLEHKFQRLLSDFEFTTAEQYLRGRTRQRIGFQ